MTRASMMACLCVACLQVTDEVTTYACYAMYAEIMVLYTMVLPMHFHLPHAYTTLTPAPHVLLLLLLLLLLLSILIIPLLIVKVDTNRSGQISFMEFWRWDGHEVPTIYHTMPIPFHAVQYAVCCMCHTPHAVPWQCCRLY